MKNLNEYIEESLLDDEDDLLDASDEAVEIYNSLESKFYLRHIIVWNVTKIAKFLNKQYIKKLNPPNTNELAIYNGHTGSALKTPIRPYIDKIVLSMFRLPILQQFLQLVSKSGEVHTSNIEELNNFLKSCLKEGTKFGVHIRSKRSIYIWIETNWDGIEINFAEITGKK